MGAYVPLDILEQIGRHCPRAMSIYALCLARADENLSLIFTKEEIRNDLSESYCKFRNDLKALAREGLLEWHEMNGKLHIILGDTTINAEI